MMLRHFYSLAKSRKSKSFTNKSIKQSKKSARGQGAKKKAQTIKQSKKSARGQGAKKKAQSRRAPAGRGRLGGGGPAPHAPNKPTPTATPEPEELTPGSLEETSLRETGSAFKTDEMEL